MRWLGHLALASSTITSGRHPVTDQQASTETGDAVQNADESLSGLRILIAHPSPDLYGSDRQLVETVTGLTAAGWRVTVAVPQDGPLVPLVREAGAEVEFTGFVVVLRRSTLTVVGILRLVFSWPFTLLRLWLVIRRMRPDAVYVNTVTVPVWLIAARLAGCPAICHVHEAEDDTSRVIRTGLAAPLLLAGTVLTNSNASRRALTTVIPRLERRTRVVYNGITGPAETPEPPSPSGTVHLALVARLAPRKGIDVALDALAQVRLQGHDLHLDICGTAFTGYDWYEAELRARADRPDLAGHVTFHGYVNPTWPLLTQATIVIVPSRVEPFGNTAVEGMLAARPVIASDVQGLAEIITHDHTGLLVPPGDPTALAHAITRLLTDPDVATRLATAGRDDATTRFSAQRYRLDVVSTVLRAVPNAVACSAD